MRILYGIQGTGNGHISRASFIYNKLKKYSQNIDVLISGNNFSLKPIIPIKYQHKGITFSITNGKIDYLKTLSNLDLYTSYIEQKKIPFESYDLIISDFEPITAWSSVRYKINSIHISHQASFLESNVPRPMFKNMLGEYIMKYFCPTNEYIGIHYQKYGPNISEPIILKHISSCATYLKDHITIYLPWYNDNYLYNYFKNFKDLKFQIFSSKINHFYQNDNCMFFPINSLEFIESVRSSFGVICNAGFQTTSEVIYLGKRLLVIPVKGQYEQECNVSALNKIGVLDLKKLDNKSKEIIRLWLESDPIKINFQDDLTDLLDMKINRLK